MERARALGLDEAVAVGNDPTLFSNAVREWTSGTGVNVILDLVGASYLAANLDALAPRGRLLLVGTMGGSLAPLNFGVVMGKRLHVISTVLRARSAEEKARATRLFAAHVGPLLARRVVRPVIDRTYKLSDLADAIRYLEQGHARGKVVISVD